MRLADKVVATFHAFACGIRHKLLHQVHSLQVLVQLFHCGILCQLLSVLVGILEGELSQQSSLGHFGVVRCISGCVLCDEDVGHDTSSTIYGASVLGFVCTALVLLYAVLGEELPVFVSVQQIQLILLVVSVGVGLLYAASRRCVVSGYGEAYGRSVFKFDRLLHQSLAKGASSDDGSSVVVLYGSGKDFAG